MPNKIQNMSIQFNRTIAENKQKCLSWVRDAANQGAEVITLPELYSSHYFCQSEDIDNFAFAEPL
jgi:N-carbamoylputrescine amidase